MMMTRDLSDIAPVQAQHLRPGDVVDLGELAPALWPAGTFREVTVVNVRGRYVWIDVAGCGAHFRHRPGGLVAVHVGLAT